VDAFAAGALGVLLGLCGAFGCSSEVAGSPRVDGGSDGRLAMDAGADAPTVAVNGDVRLVGPLSTSRVTSRRPRFRWVRANGVDGAHLQICRDRACRLEVTAFDAVDSGTPSSDLPAGVLFWRAFAQRQGVTSSAASWTWEVTVGARSAPVDTSWGTTLDVNGDGMADVLVSAPDADTRGEVALYLGRAGGPATSPTLVLPSPQGSAGYFGTFVASAGDVNGDGFGDAIISDSDGAYVFLGGPAGLASAPAVTLTRPPSLPPQGSSDFGIHVASAGDVNGDGYADVAVGDNVAGQVFVFLGGVAGPSASADFTLKDPSAPPPNNDSYGHSVEGAGDVNGDGYADVAVGANGAAGAAGQVYLYWGGPTGLASTPAVTVTGPDADSGGFGRLSCAGDVNGDGYADLAVGSDGAGTSLAGRAYIYLGGPAGYAASPDVALDSPDGAGALFGRLVAGAGDVNGDGYADLIIGADAEIVQVAGPDGGVRGPAGWAHVYLGSTAGLATSPAATLVGPDGPSTWFGRSVAGPGDVDGDGYDDVLVGAPAEETNQPGFAHLYFGDAVGLSPSRSTTFTGPSSASHFGLSVASVLVR